MKMSYFSETFFNKNKIEVELNVSSYTKYSDLKTATSVDSSQFPKKDDLASLKSDNDK